MSDVDKAIIKDDVVEDEIKLICELCSIFDHLNWWLVGISQSPEWIQRHCDEFGERCEWIFTRSASLHDWLERWTDEARGGEPCWASWLGKYCDDLRAKIAVRRPEESST